MSALKLIRAETEERPRYFEFKKSHILGFHPRFPKVDYDPFPEAKDDDVVRSEIIGRELVLTGKVEGDDSILRPGFAFQYEGKTFAILSAKIDFETAMTEIEASSFTQLREPPAVLAELRAFYATNNRVS